MASMRANSRFPGLCLYCSAEVTRTTAPAHLRECSERKAALKSTANKRQSVYQAEVYYLRAEATYLPEFWLDLEVRGDAQLQDLDDYLRAIWLECCGHMSAFTLGGWGTPQLAKEGFVGDVFRHRAKIMHVYDFGTESWTTLKRLSVRQGQPATLRPISLMVRNQLPEVVCLECGAPAQWLCSECVVEEDRMGFLCARHRKTHPHDNYGAPLKVVNSPRLGLCGYMGPAKPPY
jgi:hypothetical protein